MKIRDQIHFSYAGKKSSDYGLYNINLEGGMVHDVFVSPRTIGEIPIRGKDKPYFQEVKREPLTFSVSFSIGEPKDFVNLQNIAKWLCGQEYYQPLFFAPEIHKIYYALFVEDSELIHTTMDSGYINLTARTNAPYAFSPIFITREYSFAGTENIIIKNAGQLPIYPEVYVTMPGDASPGFSINNLTDENTGFSFSQLANGEQLYINCEKQFIETSEHNTYRYNNMLGDFIRLLPGNNRLKLQGYTSMYFRYQCKLL